MSDPVAGPDAATPSPPRPASILALAPMGALMMLLGQGNNYDFDIYRRSLLTMLHGGSVYSYKVHDAALHADLGFLYPPFASLLMLPLALVPRDVGRTTVAAVTTVLVLLSLTLLVRELDRRRHALGRPPLSPVAVAGTTALLALTFPTISNMALGQVSFAVAALMLLDATLLPRAWRGVLVGLAGGIKLTPMILVPYYLVTRQWRAALNATVAFGLSVVLGALFRWPDSVTYWLHPSVVGGSLGDPSRVDNWSPYGVLSRAGLAGNGLTAAWLVISAAVVVTALWRARRHFLGGGSIEAVVVMGVAANLVTVATWPHHVFFLLVAIALVAWQRPLLGWPLALLAAVPAVVALAGSSVPTPGRIMGASAVALMVVIVIVGLPRTPAGARGSVDDPGRQTSGEPRGEPDRPTPLRLHRRG